MSDQRSTPPQFDAAFRQSFAELVRWRRDVRRFRTDPVSPELIEQLLALAIHAPSVGFCQPWRFVLVESPGRRAAIIENFKQANQSALAGYDGERRALYAGLKLEGLTQAPVHLAVCADEGAATGHRLGRATMPETLRYSVVAAIQTFWLAARAEGLGVGWVSILDPVAACRELELPSDWTLIAYLCIGWPQEEHDDPELERHGWEARLDPDVVKPLRR
ncbi:5,6-dimethylbenzimidazole synthase [Bradyrhizobium sp. ORS 285]|uniref:5,6-dimethylbenzimidazole synthase n=1 Tax=Bradyrhizobium sp. ORS 285 TaxID=115808 RepID=UPI000240AB58|nr:5,6-dimethylbenzimidazole synthase [Bradyrhizobium sp. ORS 285]CCD85290.1 putative Cob(II)yrinic acid a,c-diamide reductase, bluB [Bradyrhizobium sp. ORS 285]SMX57459.1 5,6-dimethylbenzimidazole synthase [Bradyrhizobium sp. ORS 285]